MSASVHPPEIPLVAVTGGLLFGGSSTFLVNLARAFRERGVQLPIVALSGENEHARDFASLNAPVKLISPRRHIYEDRLRLAYHELARWRPRAVLACLGGESFEVLRLVPKRVVRLGLIQAHHPGPHQLIRTYSDWIDAVVGVSKAICEHALSFPEVARRRVERIPYGIWFGANSKRVQRQNDQPLRIIYLGRMIEEQKRVSRFVELVKLLGERQAHFRFTFAGAGPQLPALQAALSGARSVEFLGEVPNDAVIPLLEHHDLMVLLSDYEGLPLSLLEAMGAGVVPVVSDIESGIRDVVSEENGVRVPVGDVRAAADAIMALATDRHRLAEMSVMAARSVREEYSASRMAERYLQLIGEFAPSSADWPAEVSVPVPMGVRPPWLYSGIPRVLRRWTKQLIAVSRERSTRS